MLHFRQEAGAISLLLNVDKTELYGGETARIKPGRKKKKALFVRKGRITMIIEPTSVLR